VSLVVDTNVVVDLLRGREEGAALLDPAREPIFVSTVTVHEIYSGMRTGEEEMTATMLSGFVPVAFDEPAAKMTAAWWRSYRTQGVTLEFRDLAIASLAVTRGLPLATGNAKHFPMPELRVEQWPPPPV
jgi:predicted nucleic acid-binding protein